MKPRVWGHRGASKTKTENTMAAFTAAMEQGADGVELDVQLCSSGEVVVFHDQNLSRLADNDLQIREMSWKKLSATALVGGGTVPLLSEVLEELPSTATVNVELKIFAPREIVPLCRAVARCLRAQLSRRHIVISSFHPGVLAWFRLAYPGVERGVLFHENQNWPLAMGAYAPLVSASAMHPQAKLVTPSAVAKWEKENRRVHVWTVDEPDEALRLARLGVTALITNLPGDINRVFAEQGQS